MTLHPIKNNDRSNKTAKKKSVNCDIILLGSGSRVISRVMVVNVKPAKKENILTAFDRYLI